MNRDEIRAALDRMTTEDRVAVEDLVLEAFLSREHEARRQEDPEREAFRERAAARLFEACGDAKSPKARAAIREAGLALVARRPAERAPAA